MQNPGIAALGLNWNYLAFDVHPDFLHEAIRGAQRMKFVGLNLTVPHKLLAVEMMDVLDESASLWGAVNTVRFEAKAAGNEWVPVGRFKGEVPEQIRSRGFNTDADAIVRAIREELSVPIAGKRILLLGAGGAGRMAALKLASEQVAELFLVNRTVSKTEELAAEIRKRFPSVKVHVGYPNSAVDLLVNATSLGLKPDDSLPMDMGKYRIDSVGSVYDMIYRPAETPLLRIAREAGCRTANGLGMLLYQGAAALEIWSGQSAPLGVMREALMKSVYGNERSV
jgi:shikimate dehydrogenase